MSLYRHLLRRSSAPPLCCIPLRNFSLSSNPSSHIDHQRNHDFQPPNEYIYSWKPPNDPKEAQSQLALLRREYDRKVKAVRKEYIREVEFQKLEKQKKDLASMEALRIANEERKAAKEAEKKARAKEREVLQEEFRQALLKERVEKLEYWRMRSEQVEEKKKGKKEVLRRQSCEWIDESELENRIKEANDSIMPLC